MNLWHDIPVGDNTPDEANVIVEISRGSKNKYEIDKETGIIALDRVMHTAQDYPFDYGFFPQTYWHDDDALDVIILTTYPLPIGIMAHVRPVALLKMVDDGDNDDKVIAVPTQDPRWSAVHDKSDINAHTLKEIEHFFSTYKQLQNKSVEINGIEDAAAAKAALQEGIKLYKDSYPQK